VIASVSLTGTLYSHQIEQLETLAPQLIRRANEISRKLGWVGSDGSL
jgi:DNA-binding IclR family transcriptional regulator